MKHLLIFCITFYQSVLRGILESILGSSNWCRQTPSCSAYAKQKIAKYGSIKGSYLAIRRILSCQPFAASTL